jgi:outer membrane lipoprotein carrier protein
MKLLYSRILPFIFFFLLLMLTSVSVTASQNKETAAASLHRILDKSKTLQADFTQTITKENGKVVQRSSGVMKILRPGKFLWKVSSPNPQTIIANGNTLWDYDPDLEQVTIRTWDAAQARSPAALLSSNNQKLISRYTISQKKSPTGHQFVLIPKDDSGAIQSATLFFTLNNVLKRLILKDKLGQKTKIVFVRVKINSVILKSNFIFTQRKGIDVVDLTKQ